jgi:type III pantothenate kinase
LILCVGIGNTNVRCAIGGADEYSQAALLTEELCCAEKFVNFLEDCFGAGVWGKLQSCIVSSVVPQKNDIVVAALRYRGGELPISTISEKSKKIVFSQYSGILGEDRIVCCEAAAAKYGAPVVVIDLGTATTINAVGADGVFRGGAILTGVQTGLNALTERTAQLPNVDNFTNIPVIGNNTHDCLASGAVFGTICMIEGYIKRITPQLNATPTVVITGGNATKILPYCRDCIGLEYVHEPTLLLDGLFLLKKR